MTNTMKPLLWVVVLLIAQALVCSPVQAQARLLPGDPNQVSEKSSPAAATPRSTTAVDSAGASVGGSAAASGHPRAVAPTGRQSIGLVLEGGGALGLAHIGVVQWFEENHIPVDSIAGTSMGGLIGGLYASGRSADDLRRIATSDVFSGLFAVQSAYTDVDYRRRQDRKELPQAISFGLKNGVSFRNAVLTDTGLNAFLLDVFSAYNREGLAFDELPIPFRCVATDLNSLLPVVFDGGSMPQAIRASISIPGIFSPVSYRGHYLVDGAIMDNLPTDVARNELHADVIIAVHLATSAFAESDVNSVLGIFSRAFSAGTARTERAGMQLADVLVEADTAKFSTSDYQKGRELIDTGYRAAELRRSELIRYRLNDSDWNTYLAARTSRMRPSPGILRQVKVEGGTGEAQAAAKRGVASLAGRPIDMKEINKGLWRVGGSGSYGAWYETFSDGPAKTADATTVPDTGLLIHLREARTGRAFLMVGADVTATTSNVTRNTMDFRYVHRDLGGFGSELRSDVRVGFLTQVSAEYYRRLTASGLFLQPHVGIIRQAVYLWANQKRISERFEQQAGGGLDLGRTFNRNTQLSAEWRMQSLRWHLTNGDDNSTNISGTAQSATLHYSYDNAVTGAVSPRGLRLDVNAGSLFNAVASETAPLVQIRASKTYTFREKNIIGFGTDVDTFFRRKVADPLRFTLGGPLRLSASSIDEYRGTDDILIRSGYLRRIAALPSGLGQGVYLTVAYEAGEIWSPVNRAVLRQDGVAGVVAATPLGVLTFAGSIGDAGRRKVFFTLGRLF
jgi:NTE family protein